MTPSYYVQVILTLAVFIAVIVALQRFTKYMYHKKYAGQIIIKDRLAIDSGAALVLVSVKEDEFLLSVGGKEVKLLKHFS